MRTGIFVLFTALLTFPPGIAAEGPGDFTGTWTMDPTRSESAHQDVPTGTATLVIRLTDSELSMETTRNEADKPFHEILTFRLDGSETSGTGDGGVRVTGKAHWDGPKLVVETSRNVQDSTVTTLYVHTLSANRRDLTIDKTLTVQHGYQGGNSAPTTGHGKDVFVRASQ